MKEKLRFLGLGVHAETIAVAIAEPDGEVRSLGTIPNRAESMRKLIKQLGPAEKLRACYEPGQVLENAHVVEIAAGFTLHRERAQPKRGLYPRAGCYPVWQEVVTYDAIL